MTQRDDMGKVVGGGFRVVNSCIPVVDSCQYMAQPIQYCKAKKIIFKLKKKGEAKRDHYNSLGVGLLPYLGRVF